ncbi:hypothetical protein ACU8V6_00180 [Vibrio alginolyticus]
MTNAAISVRGIEKSYKDLHVLRGVDFEVERAASSPSSARTAPARPRWCVSSPTLLKADTGTATVQGIDVAANPVGVRECISLTGQFAAVDEILTGRENLVLVAKLRHLP